MGLSGREALPVFSEGDRRGSPGGFAAALDADSGGREGAFYLLTARDVEEVLDCYFRACSIQADCRALAHIGAVLSNRGRLPASNERVFPAAMSRYVNAVLMTCGMYDGSGEFALRVGVPAKSGVGGGIMAVVPTRMGIGIFGPALDRKGMPEVPLSEEMRYVNAYLYIVTQRFGERLRVDIDLPGELMGCKVPRLILQPVIENAVEHGITPAGRGRVALRGRRRGLSGGGLPHPGD